MLNAVTWCQAIYARGCALTVHHLAVSQHNALVERMDVLEGEACEDVRALARLWQLQNKMESIGAGGTYGLWLVQVAHITIIGRCSGVPHCLTVALAGASRFSHRARRRRHYRPGAAPAEEAGTAGWVSPTKPSHLQLHAHHAHGGVRQSRVCGRRYARVANMIEIEVEIDTEVPAAEVAGIEEQILRLEEVAEMQADWRLQAEAQDEVERLLRAT